MKTSDMEWKVLPIGQLKPAAYNPRKQLKPGDKEYEKIKHSIQEFGYVEPIIVNYDMTVIGGHQRLTVLKEMGYEEVQCVVVHIEDEHKVKALNIALNKITGAWNEQLLADLIVDLQSKEDDFDVDGELEQPAMSKAGDIWLMREHRVICGDATLPETYTRLMDGKKANLVLTDPPYNVDVEETAGKIKNDNMPDDKFYQFLFSAFVNMEQNMERDASIYVFHADTQGLNFRKAFKDAGFYLSGCCIWKKNALVLGRSPYQWQHEPCLFGWKLNGKHQWYSDRKQTTIWEYDRPKASKEHPTMKPVALMAYPIQNSSMSHCIVLDPFLGSGSTLMACQQTDRICYGIELDEKFVDVIVKRYISECGSEGVFVLRGNEKIPYDKVQE